VKQQLTALRIIWGALLMGQVVFLVIALAIGKNMNPRRPPDAQLQLYCAIGMLAVLVPMAYVMRAATYRKGLGEDGLITPQFYGTGNIMFFAMCEGVGLAAITFGLLNQGRGPVFFVAAVAIAVQVVNFPTGSGVRWE
jgi:hypothetical protein